MNETEPPKEPLRIDCQNGHGKRLWKGHIICGRCGRVYQASDEKKSHHPTDPCACGAKLLGEGTNQEISGRAICDYCYRKIVKNCGGVVPNWRPRTEAAS